MRRLDNPRTTASWTQVQRARCTLVDAVRRLKIALGAHGRVDIRHDIVVVVVMGCFRDSCRGGGPL